MAPNDAIHIDDAPKGRVSIGRRIVNMRSQFAGYYYPTADEYALLWREGLICLDANVLLDLYRFNAETRREFIKILHSVKDRLWIPHQFALEFQRNRLSTIHSVKEKPERLLNDFQTTLAEIETRILDLEIDKYGLDLAHDNILAKLKQAQSDITDAISRVKDSMVDASSTDEIRDELDILLDGRVGPAHENQASLESQLAEAAHRYESQIPPGFEDANKGQDGSDIYYFNGIKYEGKYGDLIGWMQIIDHVREEVPTGVILITSDRKRDWWQKEDGRYHGPHPELVHRVPSPD